MKIAHGLLRNMSPTTVVYYIILGRGNFKYRKYKETKEKKSYFLTCLHGIILYFFIINDFRAIRIGISKLRW